MRLLRIGDGMEREAAPTHGFIQVRFLSATTLRCSRKSKVKAKF